jgi:2-oxoglutarate/2-oxoacid ferredoxin oxidoreductase subunit beta
MPVRKYLRPERLPTYWCPGCGDGLVIKTLAEVFHDLGCTSKNTVLVSGIGCAARAPGYFSLESVHGLHGRAVPIAEGIKTVRPELNVVIVSGDGDLLGIGGNHLVHASRRNTDIKIILIDNQIYGMTGGQKSPTTAIGVKTLTSPGGNTDRPVDCQSLVKAHGSFYARATTFHLPLMKKAMRAALDHKGFALVDVRSQCPVNFGRRLGYRNAYEMLMWFKKNYAPAAGLVDRLGPNEIGITK